MRKKTARPLAGSHIARTSPDGKVRIVRDYATNVKHVEVLGPDGTWIRKYSSDFHSRVIARFHEAVAEVAGGAE